MKNPEPTITNRVAKFCGICDNYTGKNGIGCRVLMPNQQVVRVTLDNLCESGLVEGHKAYISPDSVNIDGKEHLRKDSYWMKKL